VHLGFEPRGLVSNWHVDIHLHSLPHLGRLGYLGCLDTVHRLYRVMAGYSISDGTQFERSPFPSLLIPELFTCVRLVVLHIFSPFLTIELEIWGEGT
jgi:hypothetical protein